MIENVLIFLVSVALGLLVLTTAYSLLHPRKYPTQPPPTPPEDKTFKLNKFRLQRPKRRLCAVHVGVLKAGEVAFLDGEGCDICRKNMLTRKK